MNYFGDQPQGHNHGNQNGYQGGNYQGSGYQGGNYQGSGYQGGNYQGSGYQGENHQGSGYQGENHQGSGYQGGINNYYNDTNGNYSPFMQTIQPSNNEVAKVSDLYGAARTAFIKKVIHKIVQLLFTVFLTGLSMASQSFFKFQIQHIALFYIAVVLALVIEIYVFCCQGGRTYPQNVIITTIFTFCEGYIVSFISSSTGKQSGNSVVFLAAFMTLAIVVGCTLYAIFTQSDFTTCGALLVVVSILMLILFVVLLFTNSPFLHTLYCALGVFLCSVYLIIDTQMIVGGRSIELAVDEYYLGAMLLYVDIITLFLYLLELFKGNQ